MSGEGAHPDHISILRKDGRSFLPPGHWDKPDATPQNYSAAGSADCRQLSAAWTLQTPALRSRGWGCPHLLLASRSVVAVRCPGQIGFPHAMMPLRLWCYGETSSRNNPQDKCLQSVRAFHRSIRIQAAPATVVGAMPTLGCLYTRWVRRWVA